MAFEEIESGVLGEFPYTIRKHPDFWTLNGYLGVPVSHPWYGKDKDDIDANCHGGLTYSVQHDGIGHFDHLPAEMLIWWVGFDCGHAWDIIPGIDEQIRNSGREPFPHEGSTYKDRNYVFNELERLAQQASEAIQVSSSIITFPADREK